MALFLKDSQGKDVLLLPIQACTEVLYKRYLLELLERDGVFDFFAVM